MSGNSQANKLDIRNKEDKEGIDNKEQVDWSIFAVDKDSQLLQSVEYIKVLWIFRW